MSISPENQADDIVNDFDLSLPIDVQAVCDQLSSNTFKIEYLKVSLPDHICGMSIGNRNSAKLLVNSKIAYQERLLFTGGHELGHGLLHIQTGIASDFECSDNDLKENESLEKKWELEANQFGSALLMPRNVIKNKINHSDITWSLIREIATLCNTSLEATARRIISLTKESYALIIHQSQKMWTPVKSKNFPVFISNFAYPKNLISTLVTKNQFLDSLEECEPSNWGIESSKIRFNCYYSSIYFEENNRIMTLLSLDEVDEEEAESGKTHIFEYFKH